MAQPRYLTAECDQLLKTINADLLEMHLSSKVHESINEGTIKERLTIQLDQDLRYGEVVLDNQRLYGKVVDLPTIVESYKTIDNKNLYKTADICQLLLVKEEPEEEVEKESPNKNKKKDPNKVDKKYLWPHGITPPCKNVRKRRFRKTLKKKNVETPEIEKEVKRLLRIDNEAARVDYEIINEEDKPMDDLDQSDMKPYNEADEDLHDDTMHANNKTINESSSQREINVESDDETSNFDTHAPNRGVAAHDIFGEEVSTTDDEDEQTMPGNTSRPQQHDLEESSRLSADDSRMSDFFGASGSNAAGAGGNDVKSEFNKSMFGRDGSSPKLSAAGSSSNLAAPGGFFDTAMKREDFENLDFMDEPQPQYTTQQIQEKISELTRQISDLKATQVQKSTEIASIQNATLKQRMQEALDQLYTQVMEHELQLKDFETMLEQQ